MARKEKKKRRSRKAAAAKPVQFNVAGGGGAAAPIGLVNPGGAGGQPMMPAPYAGYASGAARGALTAAPPGATPRSIDSGLEARLRTQLQDELRNDPLVAEEATEVRMHVGRTLHEHLRCGDHPILGGIQLELLLGQAGEGLPL